jgi:hypothetical protein
VPAEDVGCAAAERDSLPLITQWVEALLLGQATGYPAAWSNNELLRVLKAWFPNERHTASMNEHARSKAVKKLAGAIAERVAARELPPDFVTGASTPFKRAPRTELLYWAERISDLFGRLKKTFPGAETAALALPVNIPGTNMWLGSCAEARDPNMLRLDDFTHVLNCARAEDTSMGDIVSFGRKIDKFSICEDFYRGTGNTHCEIGAEDTQVLKDWSPLILQRKFVSDSGGRERYGESCEPSEMLSKALAFVDGADKVLVHCVQGLKRSAFVCVAYLVLQREMDMMLALETVFVARKHEECLENSIFQFAAGGDSETNRRDLSRSRLNRIDSLPFGFFGKNKIHRARDGELTPPTSTAALSPSPPRDQKLPLVCVYEQTVYCRGGFRAKLTRCAPFNYQRRCCKAFWIFGHARDAPPLLSREREKSPQIISESPPAANSLFLSTYRGQLLLSGRAGRERGGRRRGGRPASAGTKKYSEVFRSSTENFSNDRVPKSAPFWDHFAIQSVVV